MFVACDLTLGPSPIGEGGLSGGRIAVVPLLLQEKGIGDEVAGQGGRSKLYSAKPLRLGLFPDKCKLAWTGVRKAGCGLSGSRGCPLKRPSPRCNAKALSSYLSSGGWRSRLPDDPFPPLASRLLVQSAVYCLSKGEKR